MTPYDRWILRGPSETVDAGQYACDICLRVHEPDEDAPRGYKPKPCDGVMIEMDGIVFCDTCAEIAE